MHRDGLRRERHRSGPDRPAGQHGRRFLVQLHHRRSDPAHPRDPGRGAPLAPAWPARRRRFRHRHGKAHERLLPAGSESRRRSGDLGRHPRVHGLLAGGDRGRCGPRERPGERVPTRRAVERQPHDDRARFTDVQDRDERQQPPAPDRDRRRRTHPAGGHHRERHGDGAAARRRGDERRVRSG